MATIVPSKNPLKAVVIIVALLIVGYSVLGFFNQFLGHSSFQHLSLPSSTSNNGRMAAMSAPESDMMAYEAKGAADFYFPPPIDPDPVAPTANPNRLVITDTSISMVVKSVNQTIDQINQVVTAANGFLVNSYLNKPSEAASGHIVLRVPTAQRDAVVEQIKALGLRITEESVTGRDVTDQYEDVQARLDVLFRTQAKFQVIQDQAEEISDLLQVQRELINIQQQIDNLRGRAQYYEQNAQLSKITVNLATDELALPLTPDQAWRPELVFRQAIRSLIMTLRSFAYSLIWVGVYAAIWAPVALLGFIGWKLWTRKLTSKQSK